MAILRRINKRVGYILIVALASLSIIIFLGYDEEQMPPEIVISSSENVSVELNQVTNQQIHIVKDGESMTEIFEMYEIPLNLTYRILKSPYKNKLTNIIPGEEFRFMFNGQKLEKIILKKNEYQSIEIINRKKPIYNEIKKTPNLINSFRAGLITSSFYEAGIESDIPDSVIMDLAYIFGWDIDFVYDIRDGDKFRVLYETAFIDGQIVENGSILYAEFFNQDKKYIAIRYKNASDKYEYYDENGRSIKKAFLRAPLDFAYISSHFNPRRMHPILNRIRAHNGVDYAASRNTPIRATGSGIIIFQGRRGGYGRTIEIRHGGEITTLYAHLERFNPKYKVGSKVEQGATIGYVGDSGQATGPHLHYEFKVGNNRSDPVRVELPNDKPIPKERMQEFIIEKNKFKEISDTLTIKDLNAKEF